MISTEKYAVEIENAESLYWSWQYLFLSALKRFFGVLTGSAKKALK